ncbi:hypothetical protein HOY82DRAFT_544013 [Tuber indicum]|nr:hypothetical protein HOY82DRAFT_544013 [Tuber indicum]
MASKESITTTLLAVMQAIPTDPRNWSQFSTPYSCFLSINILPLGLVVYVQWRPSTDAEKRTTRVSLLLFPAATPRYVHRLAGFGLTVKLYHITAANMQATPHPRVSNVRSTNNRLSTSRGFHLALLHGPAGLHMSYELLSSQERVGASDCGKPHGSGSSELLWSMDQNNLPVIGTLSRRDTRQKLRLD